MSDDSIALAPRTDEVLAEAERLLSGGEPRAAIAVLTDENHLERSELVERRLVDVRTRGFDLIERGHGRDAWPRDVGDPFPEVEGVPPEIHASELDPDLLAGAILHHGSLIVRELVAPEEVAALRDSIARAFDDRAAYLAADEPEPTAWYTPFAAGRHHEAFASERFVRIIDSPRTLSTLLDTYDHNGLIDIITEHLGERPALSAHKCALRRLTPNPDERSSDYHQDGSFLGAGIRTVNVWLPLNRCGGPTSTTAGIDVIPRRIDRILETGVEGAFFDWTISEAVVARAAEGTPVVRPVFDAGDAMLFDEVMVHRTGLSEGMTDERMAVEAWFFAPSAYPDDHVPILV
jgi:hypothetical protein